MSKPDPTSAPVPVFGERRLDRNYLDRPGGYVVLRNDAGRLAAVETMNGVFLPGGGQRETESARDAAIRETFEETGLAIRIVRRIGAADEFLHAISEGAHYRKRCEFFAGVLTTDEPGSGAPDHELVWLTDADAQRVLSHESQRYAVRHERCARSAS